MQPSEPVGRLHAELVDQGFVVIPRALDSEIVRRLARDFTEKVKERQLEHLAGTADFEEGGVIRFPHLPADGDLKALVDHPTTRAVAELLFGRTVTAEPTVLVRAPLPGFGLQGIHPDRSDVYAAHEAGVAIDPEKLWPWLDAMWCISEFTPDNGPLRVVPRSHIASIAPIPLDGTAGMGPVRGEVRIVAPAGSVILFNAGALWHSGTLNYSFEPRIAVTTKYTAESGGG